MSAISIRGHRRDCVEVELHGKVMRVQLRFVHKCAQLLGARRRLTCLSIVGKSNYNLLYTRLMMECYLSHSARKVRDSTGFSLVATQS